MLISRIIKALLVLQRAIQHLIEIRPHRSHKLYRHSVSALTFQQG